MTKFWLFQSLRNLYQTGIAEYHSKKERNLQKYLDDSNLNRHKEQRQHIQFQEIQQKTEIIIKFENIVNSLIIILFGYLITIITFFIEFIWRPITFWLKSMFVREFLKK